MPTYSFLNPDAAYFVTFRVVAWQPILTNDQVSKVLLEAVNFYTRKGDLEVFAFCLMPDHVHMVIRSQCDVPPGELLGRVKAFSSKEIIKLLKAKPQQRPKSWLEEFGKAGSMNDRNKGYQVWEQYNHPQEITSNEMITQKIDYIHNNPVRAGIVKVPWKYALSSAIDYSGGTGLVEKLTVID